jgi:hypothetical protein
MTIILVRDSHSNLTGEEVFSHVPDGGKACCAIFSLTEPNMIFAVSVKETLRISIADGSVTPFKGHPGGAYGGYGDAMATSDSGSMLYVGYSSANCVVALSTMTMESTWKKDMADSVNSVSYHAGLLLVGVYQSEFCVLNAENGDVLRKLFKAPYNVLGHMVISGVFVFVLLESSKCSMLSAPRASCMPLTLTSFSINYFHHH